MQSESDPSDWRTGLVRDGYALIPNMISAELVSAAREAIARDLAEHFDPARQTEYDHKSYCPDIRDAPEIMALLLHPNVHALLNSIIEFDRLDYEGGQISIRRARNAWRRVSPKAHIDGVPTLHNGVVGAEINSFTMLVGVFLSDVNSTYAGNFTVWPGSHHTIEHYFCERGPKALIEGMPILPLGKPVQLTCSAGSVVICHYQLAHAAAANTAGVDRTAVYFRLRLTDIDSRRWHRLTHIWDGWRIGPKVPECAGRSAEIVHAGQPPEFVAWRPTGITVSETPAPARLDLRPAVRIFAVVFAAFTRLLSSLAVPATIADAASKISRKRHTSSAGRPAKCGDATNAQRDE
jgi:hypothetical protein